MKYFSSDNGRKKHCGVILVLVTASMVALIAIIGFALDTGMLYYKFRQAQSAADAAALAGALEIYNDRRDSFISAAKEAAKVNHFEDGQDGVTVTVNSPPSGIHKDDKNAVEVVVQQDYRVSFLSVLGFDVLPYSARAVASKISRPDDICLYTLDDDKDTEKSLHIDSGSKLTANCGVWVHSTNDKGAYVDGECLQATTIRVAADKVVREGNCGDGGFDCTDGGDCPVTGYEDDPFDSITAPDVDRTHCDHAGEEDGSRYKPYEVKGVDTLKAGTYCGGILISGKEVKFSPGPYILRGGGLDIASGSKVTGDGVSFYNTCYEACDGKEKDKENFGPITISSGSSGELLAPPCSIGGCIRNNERLEGILFFTDPDAPTSDGPQKEPKNEISSGSGLKFSGTMYFPNQSLEISSGSGVTSINGTIVSKYFKLSSGSELELKLDSRITVLE